MFDHFLLGVLDFVAVGTQEKTDRSVILMILRDVGDKHVDIVLRNSADFARYCALVGAHVNAKVF